MSAQHCGTCTCIPRVIPDGCKCADEWPGSPPAICTEFRPRPGNGDACRGCMHSLACHACSHGLASGACHVRVPHGTGRRGVFFDHCGDAPESDVHTVAMNAHRHAPCSDRPASRHAGAACGICGDTAAACKFRRPWSCCASCDGHGLDPLSWGTVTGAPSC